MQYLITSTVPSVLFLVSLLRLMLLPPASLLTYQVMRGPGLADLTRQETPSGPDQSERSSGPLGLSSGPRDTLSCGPLGMAGVVEGQYLPFYQH